MKAVGHLPITVPPTFFDTTKKNPTISCGTKSGGTFNLRSVPLVVLY
jgi:hypothetical protein